MLQVLLLSKTDSGRARSLSLNNQNWYDDDEKYDDDKNYDETDENDDDDDGDENECKEDEDELVLL